MQHLRYKFRLYPTEEQELKLLEHCNAARFTYNQLLAQNIELYQVEKKFLFAIGLTYKTKELREKHDFLKNVLAQSLQVAALNSGKSFTNKFKHNRGFPKFKCKRNNRQSFTIPQRFHIDGNRIKLPKIGYIDMVNSRLIQGKAKSVTIIKDVNSWYASILVEQDDKVIEIVNFDNAVGIDFGIKTFVVTSDGETFDLPNLEPEYKKLKTLQRRHSKKKKDSKNRDKARIKVARQYRKITRIKTDAINNFVAAITKSYDLVCIENLNIQGMKKNRCLAPSIQQLPWYLMKSKLKEKAKSFHEVSRWFPSSKTCSSCGTIKKYLTLADRTFDCNHCGHSMDRDLNAAINLRNNYRTVATAGIACGENVRPDIDLVNGRQFSTKQECEFGGTQAINLAC